MSSEQRYKMAASSTTADLALDDIKKADEIISMAVLGKCLSYILTFQVLSIQGLRLQGYQVLMNILHICTYVSSMYALDNIKKI